MAKILNTEAASGIQQLAAALCSLVDMNIIKIEEAREILRQYSVLPREQLQSDE